MKRSSIYKLSREDIVKAVAEFCEESDADETNLTFEMNAGREKVVGASFEATKDKEK